MFEDILKLFESNPIHRVALVASIGSNIVKTFDQEFEKDHNAKMAAIDGIIALLASHKEALKGEAVEAVKPIETTPAA